MMRTSEDSSLLNSLNLAIDRLQGNAKQGDPGVSWNELNELFSGTGRQNFLLYSRIKET
jgi:hypothetical protein